MARDALEARNAREAREARRTSDGPVRLLPSLFRAEADVAPGHFTRMGERRQSILQARTSGFSVGIGPTGVTGEF